MSVTFNAAVRMVESTVNTKQLSTVRGIMQ